MKRSGGCNLAISYSMFPTVQQTYEKGVTIVKPISACSTPVCTLYVKPHHFTIMHMQPHRQSPRQTNVYICPKVFLKMFGVFCIVVCCMRVFWVRLVVYHIHYDCSGVKQIICTSNTFVKHTICHPVNIMVAPIILSCIYRFHIY